MEVFSPYIQALIVGGAVIVALGLLWRIER